jgi:hypothetical protein
MKFMTTAVSFLHPIRFLFTVLMGTLLFLLSVGSVQAANAPQSKTTDGTTQLNKILDRAEEVAHSAPMSLEENEKRANEGLNEVQGAADYDKFKSGNSQPPIVESIEKAMDKISKK